MCLLEEQVKVSAQNQIKGKEEEGFQSRGQGCLETGQRGRVLSGDEPSKLWRLCQ